MYKKKESLVFQIDQLTSLRTAPKKQYDNYERKKEKNFVIFRVVVGLVSKLYTT